jgi:hypothetical protein
MRPEACGGNSDVTSRYLSPMLDRPTRRDVQLPTLDSETCVGVASVGATNVCSQSLAGLGMLRGGTVCDCVCVRTLVLCMVTLGACSDVASRPSAMRDSAGVAIVDHTAAQVAALPTWELDTAPRLRIAGDSANPFGNIRDAIQRRDGDVIVADAMLGDIRQFRSDGALVRIIARAGRGPGEVGIVRRLQLLPNDSLAFVDGNNRRTSVFDSSGRFVRQLLNPRIDDATSFGVYGLLGDGRLLTTVRAAFVEAPPNRDSVYRTPFALAVMRLPRDSASARPVVDTVAVVPDGESYRDNTTENGETRADEWPVRFGRSTVFAADAERIAVATNVRDGTIEIYTLRGLTHRIQTALVAEPFTDAHKQRFLQEIFEQMDSRPRPPSARADLRRIIDSWRYATTLAPISRLLLGTDRSLFVEQPSITSDEARRYVAFDSAGVAVARITLPARTLPLRLSLRDMLGVQMDANDVPQVVRWTWRGR